MPAQIQLDEVTKSAFEADVRGIRYLQAGVALGITDPSGAPETKASQLLARLLNLSGLDPTGKPIQIPQIGTPHPIYPQCMVTGYRVTGASDTSAQFQVVYESPSGYGLNFIIGQWYPFRTNTVGEIETWVDYTKKPITVRYKPPGGTTQTIRAGSGRKREAYSDLMLTGVFLNDITNEQESAVGKINENDNWYGKKKATWLCTGSVSRPEIFGYSWRLTAQFSNNPATWDAFDRFIDPNTGQPPPDIDPGDLFTLNMINPQTYRNGVTRARVQESADFASLFGNQ